MPAEIGLAEVDIKNSPPPLTPNADGTMPIAEAIDFFPIYLDPYLRDPVTWDHGAVVLDYRTGAPNYHLSRESTGLNQSNGSLLHRPSGLLFVPLPFLFDETTRMNVNKKDQSKEEPGPNMIFEGTNFTVYERCLALVCSSVDPDHWELARMPVAAAPFHPIRRASPDQLPMMYRERYSQLLALLPPEKPPKKKSTVSPAVDKQA